MRCSIRPLSHKVAELGAKGEGGIQAVKIEDVRALFEQHQERVSYINEVYQKGEAPIHVICEQLNIQLAELFHLALAENKEIQDPLRRSPVLVRHGGRQMMTGFPDRVPSWRLNVDITGLLLAAHFNLLDKVEEVFQPIHIPAQTVSALTQMRENVLHHQPSRLEAHRTIQDLVENGLLNVVELDLMGSSYDKSQVEELGAEWLALVEQAQVEEGYVVDFLPKRKRGTDNFTQLPEEIKQQLVNCRSVLDAMRDQGPLSQTAHEDAIRRLGSSGMGFDNVITPSSDAPLFCFANTADELASAGVLRLICEHFDVYITTHEYSRIKQELLQAIRAQELSEWLEQLTSRLSDGLENGAYKIIPSPIRNDEQGQIMSENLGLGCLMTLMQFEYQEGDVIWGDDRYMNGYSRRDAIPIIGINEVLKVLVTAGKMSSSKYYEKLIEFRAANLYYIPVHANEILYHIEQANIVDGQLIETQELSIIRRYIAASLAKGEILQCPPLPGGSSNEFGEVEFILSLGHEITNAIITLWQPGETTTDSAIRSEWILNNLYLDHLGMSEAIGWHRPNQDDLFLCSVSLSSFIAQAITFPRLLEEQESNRRHAYFDWIWHRVLRSRLEANPAMLPAVVDILKKSLFRWDAGVGETNPEPLMIGLLQLFYTDLPEAIQEELSLDVEFMEYLGLESIISIGGWDFKQADLFTSLPEVIKGKTTSLTPLNSDDEIIVRQVGLDGPYAFSLTGLTADEPINIGDEIFALLSESISEREHILRKNRQWFDCDGETLERIVIEIATTMDASSRIEQVEKWRNTNSVAFYDNLYKKLKQTEEIRLDALRPPASGSLLHHFRLSSDIHSDSAVLDAIDIAATKLLNEEGLLVALDRLVGLPIPLPSFLIKAVIDLNADEKQTLFDRFSNTANSPVSQAHIIYLLVHLAAQDQAFHQKAKQEIESFVLLDQDEFEAFYSVLVWVDKDFFLWSETESWSAQIRLMMVWAHAHRLFVLLKSLGVPFDWMNGYFKQASQIMTSDLFERNPQFSYDITNPTLVDRTRFIFSGLSYALGKKISESLDETIKGQISSIAIQEVKGKQFPVLPLMRDVSLATNSINSFLGSNYDELLITALGQDVFDLISGNALKQWAESSVNKLIDNNDDFSAWVDLHAVVGGLPPLDSLGDTLKSLLSNVSFVNLVESNIGQGNFALRTASQQSVHLKDEKVHQNLRNALLNVTTLLARENPNQVKRSLDLGDPELQVMGLLLEISLNLSISSDQSVREFCRLVTELVEIWPSMVTVTRPIVHRLYEELPVQQAKELSSLLVRLRAER